MLKLLIDTSVWLSIAEDPKQQAILRVIKELIELRKISILLPEIVRIEFDRNKERIINNSGKSLPDVIRRARQMVDKLGATDTKNIVIQHLNDIEFKIPTLKHSSQNCIQDIEDIFNLSQVILTTEQNMVRAGQRAVDKRAPFHRNKNSFNDAILIETYSDCLKAKHSKSIRYAFVTHNTSDFSKPIGNQKEPHPDLNGFFTTPNSLYYINLAEAIKKVSPRLVTALMIEQEDWEQEPRHLSEILEALDILFDQVWYNRHHNWLYQIEIGEHKIIKKSIPGIYNPNETPENVYKAARKAARLVEKKRGLKNLGPWDDFEWGMLNGKMSALRWVLGDEWDFLDN
jgi:ArsR family metal-binding transcriptional regulator